jgi:hypothetical protein
MMSSQSFECNAPDVVFENFGDEVVLLNLQSGKYFSLDPIGMVCWDYLVQGVRLEDIVGHVRAFYRNHADTEEIAQDLEALLADFQFEQLIRPTQTVRPLAESVEPGTKLPAAYARPALAKFDDVAEMLLMDPVHDVGQAGWPNPVVPPEPPRE